MAACITFGVANRVCYKVEWPASLLRCPHELPGSPCNPLTVAGMPSGCLASSGQLHILPCVGSDVCIRPGKQRSAAELLDCYSECWLTHVCMQVYFGILMWKRRSVTCSLPDAVQHPKAASGLCCCRTGQLAQEDVDVTDKRRFVVIGGLEASSQLLGFAGASRLPGAAASWAEIADWLSAA